MRISKPFPPMLRVPRTTNSSRGCRRRTPSKSRWQRPSRLEPKGSTASSRALSPPTPSPSPHLPLSDSNRTHNWIYEDQCPCHPHPSPASFHLQSPSASSLLPPPGHLASRFLQGRKFPARNSENVSTRVPWTCICIYSENEKFFSVFILHSSTAEVQDRRSVQDCSVCNDTCMQ